MSPISPLPHPPDHANSLSSSVGRAKNMNIRIIKDAKNDGFLWLGWLGRLSSACASCSGCVQKPFSAAAAAVFSHHSRADFIASSFSLSLSLAAAFKTEGPGWHVNTAYHGGSVSFGWVETISRGPNGRGRRGRK